MTTDEIEQVLERMLAGMQAMVETNEAVLDRVIALERVSHAPVVGYVAPEPPAKPIPPPNVLIREGSTEEVPVCTVPGCHKPAQLRETGWLCNAHFGVQGA